MRKVTVTIRTADRHPGPNYLGRTVRSLMAGGCDTSDLHLVLTDPADQWVDIELGNVPVIRHRPLARRTPNANGLAQIAVLTVAPSEWILMLEDDVEVCADFLGSVTRWLTRHAVPEVHVYRFCAFGAPSGRDREVTRYPLREQRGSQAIALRADEARDLVAWAAKQGPRWRPSSAPFQDDPTRGFDKLVGYWALARWPQSRNGYVSAPHFVRHTGRSSGLYRQTAVNDAAFAGVNWRYRGAA